MVMTDRNDELEKAFRGQAALSIKMAEKKRAEEIETMTMKLIAAERAVRAEELAIPKELEDLLMTLGKVEWGATAALDAEGHAQHIAKSVTNSAKHFEQEGPQPMHGLYLDGTEIVVCHTGGGVMAAILSRAHNIVQALPLYPVMIMACVDCGA
jgi:hypothetical protein